MWSDLELVLSHLNRIVQELSLFPGSLCLGKADLLFFKREHFCTKHLLASVRNSSFRRSHSVGHSLQSDFVLYAAAVHGQARALGFLRGLAAAIFGRLNGESI